MDIIKTIRAEIERRHEENREKARYDDYYHGINDGLDSFESFLDTLESGSSDIPNDLEEAARSKLDDFDAVAYMGNMEEGQSPLYDMQQMLAMFISGSKWDRQQMLKEAVKGEIFDDYDKDTCEHHLTILSTVPSGYKDGDKVHIIIVKDR